jgi:MFS family permease
MFLHERGGYNTLYFAVYFGAVQLGAIIGGIMAGRVGWRSFFWLNVALLGAVFVAQLFLFPETKWHRVHPRELAVGTEPLAPISETDKTHTPHHSEIGDDSPAFHGVKQSHESTPESGLDPYLRKGYPAKSQFRLWQLSERPLRTIGLALWVPWRLFAFPIVELSAFIVSFSASMNLTVNFTQAQFFSAPPYNFSSEQVGYTNFAILVGTGLGLLTNGKLSDWIAQRATNKNKGIREPEMRLPAMLPYVLIMLLSNFVIAIGYAKKWNWQVSKIALQKHNFLRDILR